MGVPSYLKLQVQSKICHTASYQTPKNAGTGKREAGIAVLLLVCHQDFDFLIKNYRAGSARVSRFIYVVVYTLKTYKY